MSKMMKKVSHNGAVWCSVADTAGYLRTNSTKIRELMGTGELAYTQTRRNGQIYVSVSDLVKVQTSRAYRKK